MVIENTKKRRQSKVFDLEEASTPTKRLKSGDNVTWSATVPKNKVVEERTIPRKGTPRPKKEKSSPSTCTAIDVVAMPPAATEKEDPPEKSSLSTSIIAMPPAAAEKEDPPEMIPIVVEPSASTVPTGSNCRPTCSTNEITPPAGGEILVKLAEDRAIAIKSSRLAVDMAKSRASQAKLSLERAKRREEQAKALLVEASSERYLAEQEHEAATSDMKGAADYLLELLQGGDASKALVVTGTSSDVDASSLSCQGDKTVACSGIPATNERKDEAEIVAVESTASELAEGHDTLKAKGKDEKQGDSCSDINANVNKVGSELEDDTRNGAFIEESSVASPEKKEAEQPDIEDVKDKRMMCSHNKEMGSFTGQGRINSDTGEFERHGEGYMTTNGSDSVYRGEYCSNMRNGHGADLNQKGYGYTGGWRNDQKHGLGTTRDAACVSKGRWEHDNRVGPHSYWFNDGKACLKNHINNRDLCGPSLTFSRDRMTVKSYDDGVVEVVKPEMVKSILEEMGASIPSPSKL